MSTPAVTPGAPAAPSSKPSSEHSTFLPSDKNYRLTGQLPAESDEQKPAGSEGGDEDEQQAAGAEGAAGEASGEGTEGEGSDNAAGSEPASTQEKQPKGPATSKTPQTSENRWQKITRENRELREENQRLKTKPTGEQTTARETPQASQPATAENKAPKLRDEPQIEDVDASGKPKYKTFQEFQNDQRAWDREKVKLEIQEENAKSAQKSAQASAEQVVRTKWIEKVEAARTKHADFDAVALANDLPLKQGSPADLFILDSEHGTEVLYHLGQNKGELERINKLHALAQVKELTKIELKIAGTKPAAGAGAPAKKITEAPRPPHQTAGNGTVQKDAVEAAVEAGDSEAYIREENKKALAKRKAQGR